MTTEIQILDCDLDSIDLGDDAPATPAPPSTGESPGAPLAPAIRHPLPPTRARPRPAPALRAEEATAPATASKALEQLEAARLDLRNPPTRPAPVLKSRGIPIASRGDITTILAPAKSGKSAYASGVLAAAVLGGEEREGCDTLEIAAGVQPAGSVVIAFDTEQSKPDQFDLAKRAATRAGVDVLPDWIECYNLSGTPPLFVRAMLCAKVADLRAKGVPIWFIVIDGIADLCADVNDLRESQELTNELHGVAREEDCAVIAVIHRNEGREADPSARGHLGKQLARKAAFNITLEKDANEVTVVYSTKNRGAPILKKNGPRFAWSDTVGMHVTVNAGETSEAGAADLRELAEEVFEGKELLRFTELQTAIMEARNKKDTWADKQIRDMLAADVVRKAGRGKYTLK
jgi:hypothetical protein